MPDFDIRGNKVSDARCRKGKLIAFWQQSSQTRRCFVTINRARRHRQRQLLPFRPVGLWLYSIYTKEHNARAEGGSFVTVNEWMIFAKVIQICGRDLGDVGVRRLPAKARLRRRHRRFQQSYLAQAMRAAESGDGLAMNLPHVFHRKVKAVVRRRIHASFFIVRA